MERAPLPSPAAAALAEIDDLLMAARPVAFENWALPRLVGGVLVRLAGFFPGVGRWAF